MISLYTLGFTKKNASKFFGLLEQNNIKRLVDIRINTSSQLSGFAKDEDLKYFLERIVHIEYIYIPDFAPTKELFNSYREKKLSWEEYEIEYQNLIRTRKVREKYSVDDFDGNCFLCSEDLPDKCHRRLLVEYLKNNRDDIIIKHLV